MVAEIRHLCLNWISQPFSANNLRCTSVTTIFKTVPASRPTATSWKEEKDFLIFLALAWTKKRFVHSRLQQFKLAFVKLNIGKGVWEVSWCGRVFARWGGGVDSAVWRDEEKRPDTLRESVWLRERERYKERDSVSMRERESKGEG